MAYFSETGADGRTVEGRIGEACCPGCGEPVLAKYSLEGVLLEDPQYCPGAGRWPESTARTCFYIINTIRAPRMPGSKICLSSVPQCPERRR